MQLHKALQGTIEPKSVILATLLQTVFEENFSGSLNIPPDLSNFCATWPVCFRVG